MKKLISCTLAAVLTLGSFGVTPYAAQEQGTQALASGDKASSGVVLSLSDARASLGEEFTVDVSISDNPGMAFLNFAIQYDHDVLELTGFSDSGWNGWEVGVGKGEKAVWVKEDVSDYNGEILELTFQVLDDAPEGATEITLGDIAAFDVDNDVSVTMDAGTVTVYHRLPGDVTGNGTVDGRDLVRLKQYFAGYDVVIHEENADVNNNGSVDGRDAIRLCQYFAGYDVVLEPVSPTPTTTKRHSITYNVTNGDERFDTFNITHTNPDHYEEGETIYLQYPYPLTLYPTNDMYYFLGWYDGPENGAKRVMVIDADSKEDYELYAHWQYFYTGPGGENETPGDFYLFDGHFITYDISNGNTELAAMDIANTNPVYIWDGDTVIFTDISAPGYEFLGWYDGPGQNANRVTVIGPDNNKDHHLYAHWIKLSGADDVVFPPAP